MQKGRVPMSIKFIIVAFLLLIFTYFPAFLIISVLMLMNPSLAFMIKSSPWMLIPIIIIVTLCMALFLITIVGKRQYDQYGFKLPKGSDLRKALPIGLLAGAVLYVLTKLGNVELTFIGQPPLVYIIILSWIGAPIQEEVIFRGLFQSYLAIHIKSSITIWKWKVTTPALIGATAFSLAHLILLTVESTLGGILLVIFGAFVLGVITGHLRAETSSLISPIMVHALFNLIGTLFGFIA